MSVFRADYQVNAPTGVFGKLFLSLFFLFFLGMGSIFAWMVARDSVVGLRPWTWQKTDCEIIASSAEQAEETGRHVGKFTFEVQYRYVFADRVFTSDQYQRNPKPFSDYSDAARLAERYRPGTRSFCFVNPAAPAEAVLERASPLSVLLVLFPMIFVAIGAGGIYFTWRRKPPAAVQPISERATTAKGQRILVLFFGVFLLMGSGFFYGFFLRPVFRTLAARSWPAVPCVVIASEVQSHQGDESTTYSVNILYSYQFAGREYKANRYGFMGGSSSGYSGKAAVVARYPPGRKAFCFVNPADPTDAVLEKGLTPDMWFGLIPFVFVVVGAAGLIFAVRKGRQAAWEGAGPSGRGSSDAFKPGVWPVPLAGESGDPRMLKPKVAPWAKVLGALAIALFWNGIVSVFVFQVVKSWRSGHPEWFLTLFMIPFVLVGLGLIGAIFYFFLALFNPRPRLKLTPGAVSLGAGLRVEWEISGRVEALESFRVTLEGREEATYRRGTSTTTDKSVFAELELARVTAAQEMRSGSQSVTIPAALMHSFASSNNKIVWVIRLHGEIPRWPDLKEEFPLTVLPAARKTTRET